MKTMTTTTIDTTGYSLSHETTDPGGYKKSSIHKVTVTGPNGRSYTTTYTMGPMGLWKTNYARGLNTICHLPAKKGEEARTKKDWKRKGDWVEDYDQQTTHRPIGLENVLWCLLMDANCVRHGQSFNDFCDELGMSNDSIKAKESFDACRDTWSGLIGIGADLDKLDEMYQDY